MEDPLFVDGSIVIYTESKRDVETEPLLFRVPREGDPLKSNKKICDRFHNPVSFPTNLFLILVWRKARMSNVLVFWYSCRSDKPR